MSDVKGELERKCKYKKYERKRRKGKMEKENIEKKKKKINDCFLKINYHSLNESE